MDLEAFRNCETILSQSQGDSSSWNSEWLNLVCGELVQLFKHIQKYLVLDCGLDSRAIETSLLCGQQIIVCIKWLERTSAIELKQGCRMTSTWQFFIDRIFWCIARLKDILSNNIIQPIELSFIAVLDTALDTITPFANFDNAQDTSSVGLFEPGKMRAIIDSLVSQALAFTNVAPEEDKLPLTIYCQKVFRKCVAFEADGLEKNRQFEAIELESALYQLEVFVNDCLLRILFELFVDLKQIRTGFEKNEINVDDFDLTLDRIAQVGTFALHFATAFDEKSQIRSILASCESLDAHLVPSVLADGKCPHTKILEHHFIDETRQLHDSIQKIVDTTAFGTCLNEIIAKCVRTLSENYDCDNLRRLIQKVDVFRSHLLLNDFNLPKNAKIDECHSNFELMFKECKAIISCSEPVAESRIIKRVLILQKTVDKLHNILSPDMTIVSSVPGDFDKVLDPSGDDCTNFFEVSNIDASTCSFLYKTAQSQFISESLQAQTSRLAEFTLHTPIARSQKRVSLRKVIFKGMQRQEMSLRSSELDHNTMSLHITDILDQLTDLSTTLSGTDRDDAIIPAASPDHRIKIFVQGDE